MAALCVCGVLTAAPLCADSFEEGKQLFMNNDPQGAAALFETALSESPVNPDIYIYLPLAYYQLGEYDKSLEISNIGLSTEGTNRHIIAFNAGNTAFAAGDYINASIYYTMAIEADAQYAAPVLNRANTYMKLDKLEDAVRDYTKYLTLEPITPQRRQILDLIQLLNGEIALRKQSQNTVSAGAAAAAGTAAAAAAAGAAAGTAQGAAASGGAVTAGTAQGTGASGGAVTAGTAQGTGASGGAVTAGTAQGAAVSGGAAAAGTAQGTAAAGGTAAGAAAAGAAAGTAQGAAASGGAAAAGTAQGAAASGGAVTAGTAQGAAASGGTGAAGAAAAGGTGTGIDDAAARRQKLTEDVASSLQQTETTKMQAGSEGVMKYEQRSELDD